MGVEVMVGVGGFVGCGVWGGGLGGGSRRWCGRSGDGRSRGGRGYGGDVLVPGIAEMAKNSVRRGGGSEVVGRRVERRFLDGKVTWGAVVFTAAMVTLRLLVGTLLGRCVVLCFLVMCWPRRVPAGS